MSRPRPSACSVCSVVGKSLNIGDKSIVGKMQPSAKCVETRILRLPMGFVQGYSYDQIHGLG